MLKVLIIDNAEDPCLHRDSGTGPLLQRFRSWMYTGINKNPILCTYALTERNER